MTDKGRVIINSDEVSVDADPEKLGEMMDKIINDADFRKSFEADPVRELGNYGISVSPSVGQTITPEAIDATIQDMTEGEDVEPPNVAILVGVRVATKPATRPGVSVGVRVVTGTRTFGDPERRKDRIEDEDAPPEPKGDPSP
jgi:hypothetical protein